MTEQAKTVSVGNRKYILGSTLGVGGFSEVKKGVDADTRKRVALKIMYTEDQDAADRKSQLMQVQKEIKAMKQLNHPNIIRLLGYDLKCSVGNKRAIVMVQQLAPKGELFDYLMYTKKFNQPQAIALFHQLIAGLKAMHDSHIAHRDLKPENLLFDNQFNLKIADFGFSYHYQKGEGPKTSMRTELGTKGYMAPEIISNTKYTEKADIFAAGVILFIMLAGFPPFQNAIPSDWWFDKLKKKKYKLFWMAHERTASFSKEAKEILQDMLAPTEATRLDVNQVRQTAFYNAQHLTPKELKEELKKRKQDVDLARQREKQSGVSGNSRDTMLDLISLLPPEAQADLPKGKPLLLRSLLTNQFNEDLAKVEKKRDFLEALEGITKLENADKSQTESAIGYMKKFAQSDLTDEQYKELARFLLDKQASMEDLLAHEAMGKDTNLAEFLTSEMKKTKMGLIDDWDMVHKFSLLDNLDLPEYNLCQQKNYSFHVQFGLGLLAYCVSRFAHNRGKVLIDAKNRSIDLHMKIKKSMVLPEEDNVKGGIFWTKCSMTIKLKIRMTLRNAMKENSKWNYILTFQNISEGAMSMNEFDTVVKELTTSNTYFLATLMDKQFDPNTVEAAKVFEDYNVEGYDIESVDAFTGEEEVASAD